MLLSLFTNNNHLSLSRRISQPIRFIHQYNRVIKREQTPLLISRKHRMSLLQCLIIILSVLITIPLQTTLLLIHMEMSTSAVLVIADILIVVHDGVVDCFVAYFGRLAELAVVVVDIRNVFVFFVVVHVIFIG